MTERNQKTSFGLSNGTIFQGHEEQDYRLLLNLLQGAHFYFNVFNLKNDKL